METRGDRRGLEDSGRVREGEEEWSVDGSGERIGRKDLQAADPVVHAFREKSLNCGFVLREELSHPAEALNIGVYESFFYCKLSPLPGVLL